MRRYNDTVYFGIILWYISFNIFFQVFRWVYISGSLGKESACNAGDLGSIPGSGRSPGEGNGWISSAVFLLGKSHGQRSLDGYNPWDHKSRT